MVSGVMQAILMVLLLPEGGNAMTDEEKQEMRDLRFVTMMDAAWKIKKKGVKQGSCYDDTTPEQEKFTEKDIARIEKKRAERKKEGLIQTETVAMKGSKGKNWSCPKKGCFYSKGGPQLDGSTPVCPGGEGKTCGGKRPASAAPKEIVVPKSKPGATAPAPGKGDTKSKPGSTAPAPGKGAGFSSTVLIGIGVLVLAIIAAAIFWFTQDDGGADGLTSTSAGGFSPKLLVIGVLMLLAVGYFKTKSKTGGTASRGGVFGGSSSKPSGGKGGGGGMGPLLIVIVLVGGGAAYWYFCMQEDPRRRRGPLLG